MNDITLAEANAEERNDAIEAITNDLLSDTDRMTEALALQIGLEGSYRDDSTPRLEMAGRYSELASLLYQCEPIFKDLFNGQTLEQIAQRHSLQPLRILESIRKDCHELVERCVVAELTDKFGSDE